MHIDAFNSATPHIQYFNNRFNTKDWCIEPDTIDFIDLTYVVRGTATYKVNGKEYHVSEGDVICIPRQSKRQARSENPIGFECYAVNFTLTASDGSDVAAPLPIVSHVGIQSEVIALFRRITEDHLTRKPGHNMRVRAWFMLILQRMMEMLVYDIDTYKFDPRVKMAIRFIADNFSENLPISKVADAVSLSPVYFGSLFKKSTRTSYRDYLNSIRLNQAEDMLRTGKWNVSEVAHSCGFTDVFYFSRLFKKEKGIPPSHIKLEEIM